MAIGTISLERSKSTCRADTSLRGSNLSLGSKNEQNWIGSGFQVGIWAGKIFVWPGGTESVLVDITPKTLSKRYSNYL